MGGCKRDRELTADLGVVGAESLHKNSKIAPDDQIKGVALAAARDVAALEHGRAEFSL